MDCSNFTCLAGPGAYNITGMGSDSMRKAYIESTRRGVFGTTSQRINQITKKDETEMPGPNHYQVKEKPFKSRYHNLSSTFASVTSRLKDEDQTVRVSEAFFKDTSHHYHPFLAFTLSEPK